MRLKILTIITSIFLLLSPAVVHATSASELQQQIDALNGQISQNQQTLSGISSQADTLQNKVNGINAEIAKLQHEIDLANLQIQQTSDKIAETISKLDKQKRIMYENAKVLYKQGDPSTIEVLASSENFSEFVDKQEYLEKVKESVNKAAREIIALKDDLEKKQKDLKNYVVDQTAKRSVVKVKYDEQASLLAETRGEESLYQSKVSGDRAKVEELRKQQAAINLSAQRNVSSGGCGGYPSVWCDAPMDSLVDDWGMYNRECVSYAAWKVSATGKHMPYWGGRGNAKQWDDNAQADGIPTGSEPRVGSIAVSNAGEYGHVMYVESVNGSTIHVSQFNVGWDGRFSTADVTASGLTYIYFQ